MKQKLIINVLGLVLTCVVWIANAQSPTPSSAKQPNILVIFGDDIGQTNVSAYSFGVMGYKTPNIDRIAKEGMMFTSWARVIWILARAGSTTSMSAIASRVTDSTSSQA
jgi:hypothetical protein